MWRTYTKHLTDARRKSQRPRGSAAVLPPLRSGKPVRWSAVLGKWPFVSSCHHLAAHDISKNTEIGRFDPLLDAGEACTMAFIYDSSRGFFRTT